MKKKRKLIAAVGILILLCAAYGAVSLLGRDAQEPDGASDAIAVNDRTDVISLEAAPAGEKPYTLLVKEEEKGGRSLWLEGYDDSLALDVNAAGTLLSSLETLKAFDQVDGSPEDYGIGEDSSRARLCFADNTTLTLAFGGDTPVAGRSYVQEEETGQIYVVRKDIAERCAKPVYALRKAQLFADFFGVTEAFAVDGLEIRGKGETISLRPQTQAEQERSFSDAPSYYITDAPVKQECSDGKIDKDIVTPLLAMDEQARVAEDFPQDLEKYGFSDSQSIKINAGGKECRVLLGSETEDGFRYAKREDLPSVILVPLQAEGLKVPDIQWYDLVNTSLWMRSIDKVKTVSVTAPGGVYELTPVRNGEGDIQSGTLNGKTIGAEELKALYMKVLNIHIEGRLFLAGDGTEAAKKPEAVKWMAEDRSVSGRKPLYRVSLVTLSGDDETYDFYDVDARTCAVAQSGAVTDFYTGIAALSELEKALEGTMK